jgi:hypothetical protein
MKTDDLGFLYPLVMFVGGRKQLLEEGRIWMLAAFGHTIAQAITQNDFINLPPPYQVSHIQPFKIQAF